jgi:RNA polymerase sigma-70 factor (ECF subfamily)
MAERDEAAIIQDCRRGSQEAFRELFDRFHKRAYWIARNMVNHHEAASEVAQEAFVRVFQAIKTFDVERKFGTWLYQIVVNLCIDHLRRLRANRETAQEGLGEFVPSKGKSPVERLQDQELRERVEKVMGRMPVKYRAVLTLRDLQGFSGEEAAEILKCNSATLRWRLFRARKLFKEYWERTFDELPAG